MSDKKIIIIAVVLALGLIGAGWYFSKNNANPGPATVSNNNNTVNAVPGVILGNENAPVLIEEYTNFLCSHCADFSLQTLPKIQQDYISAGKVKMMIYVLPPYELARAGWCAAQAGKFLEFEDYIFNHQADIKQEQDVLNAAKTVGLGDNFEACYNSDEAKKASEAWYNQAGEKGVEGTPTFFVNGEKLIGALPYEDFQKAIDAKLQ